MLSSRSSTGGLKALQRIGLSSSFNSTTTPAVSLLLQQQRRNKYDFSKPPFKKLLAANRGEIATR